ncbi:MAG: phosphatase PAP2 family protein [Desulfobacteraceae bacterium]|nr:phosphatase PAP2 family protein [Desulfobacteraceae bacterium]
MSVIVPVDYQWTTYLHDHRIKQLARVMDRSLFEGEGLGGGDPVIFFLILTTIVYYLAWKKGERSRWYIWRPHLGFILTSGLACSMMLVHSLKWVMGRARPSEVLSGKLMFTDWFEFGPHYIAEGIYRGSFPSGHTAQAFVLVAVVYALVATPKTGRGLKMWGVAWGIFSVAYAVVMGLSRCMALEHWFSDVAGSIILSALLMQFIYQYLLNLPAQISFYKANGRYPETPPAWELHLCIYIVGTLIGAMACVMGIRAVWLREATIFYSLIPVGLACTWLFSFLLRRLHRSVFREIG